MTDVWISAAGLCGTTVVGALLGLIIRDLPHKWNDIILGYCCLLYTSPSPRDS